MGLRGIGAAKRKEAAAKAPKRPREPWKKRGLTRLGRVEAFLEALPVTAGICAGQRMRLLPDQRAFLGKVYGEASRTRIAIDSKPRGNGKSGLAAGLALCHLLGPESEPRGEVYVASVDRVMSGSVPRTCVQCAKIFNNRNPSAKYCSPACYHQAQVVGVRGVERQCPICAHIFRVPSVATAQRCCSKRCGYLWRDRGARVRADPPADQDQDRPRQRRVA